MQRLLGGAGAAAVTLMIMISVLGSTHGSVITGARVTFAQARDGLFFGVLGRIHPTFATPAISLWCQCVLSCLVVWQMQTFEKLTGGFIFTMWIFYALAAAAVIVLRIRRPALHRPYRCWGYPVVPVLFILAAGVMTVLSIIESPATTLPWLLVLAAGVPACYAWRRFAPARSPY
jgi:APA family basic amino acid/polyamine antiporter